MALTFNGTTKTISLTAGTTILSVRDLWSRWVDWLLTSDNSKFQLAMAQVGGNDIDSGAGTKIPIYVFLQNGWKIKPQEANHTLNVNDGILLVEGGGDPFINTAGSFVVRVNFQQPVQAISFDSGGGSGGLTPLQEQMLIQLWKLQGLDPTAPATTNLNTRTLEAGDIVIDITGDLQNVTTMTKRP